MHAADTSRLARWSGPVASAVIAIALLLWAATIGVPNGAVPGAIATVLIHMVVSGTIALAYVLGGIGLGRPLLALLPSDTPSRVWIQMGLGVCLMLFISHLAGVSGLLSGSSARVGGWLIVGVGLVLLADQVFRGDLRPETWPVSPRLLPVAAPALALLLVAACNPPGWLWESEAGGYDALSYHLQLPREWSAGARLWPLEHNVYSFLPGYVEAGYMHISALLGGANGLLANDGTGIIASQLVHALMAAVAALLVGRVLCVTLRGVGADTELAAVSGVLAGSLVLATPWVIVTASLAYNEMAVLIGLAVAILLAIERAEDGWRRAVFVGFALGVACSAKPTAMFMAVPIGGLMLIGQVPARRWPSLLLPAAIGGLVALSPWLIRNTLASGNPVFPFMTDWFGGAHWTVEQIERYRGAHAVDGGLPARLRAAMDPDRGPAHAQWAFLFPIGLTGLVIASIWTRTRRIALLLLVGCVVELGAWLVLTHVQSRFLLPLTVPLAIGFGLAIGAVIEWTTGDRRPPVRWLAIGVCVLVPISTTIWSYSIFRGERNGRPNMLLAFGVDGLTGQGFIASIDTLDPEKRLLESAQNATPPSPAVFVNAGLSAGDTLYLLGDATPLYFLVDTRYHTTWDRSPLGDAIRANPDDPDAWTRALLGEGIDYVLLHDSELDRLIMRDGWYDPSVTPAALRRWIEQPAGVGIRWIGEDATGAHLLKLIDPDDRIGPGVGDGGPAGGTGVGGGS